MNLRTDLKQARKHIPTNSNIFQTSEDVETAMEMLEAARKARLESLSRFKQLLSKVRRKNFDHEEISEQLLAAVKDGRYPGVVETLRNLILDQGGDINYCRRKNTSRQPKKDRRKKPIEERSIFLGIATTKRNVDLVQLLAPSSDQTSLDESLRIALSLDTSPQEWNVVIIELLLAHNANADREYRAFCAALETHNSDVVELLVNAPQPISHEHVSDNLCSAVRLGFLDTLFILVLAGADGNGTALKEAARRGRLDLLMAITLCETPPPPRSLDEAVEITISENIGIDFQQKLWMMDVLLSNGARGPNTDSTLVEVTKKILSKPESTQNSTLRDMMRLMICHDTSINYKSGAAVKSCVAKTRVDLVEILLAADGLKTDLASEAFAMIDFTINPKVKAKLATILLAKGACGIPLHEALIQATRINHLGIVELLVLRQESNRASVDYKQAQALQDAVFAENLQIVEVLLTANPTTESLCLAFRHIRNTSKQGKFWLSRALLSQGAKGTVVHQSLTEAIADKSSMRDERLIQLLVEAGAKVDQHLDFAVLRTDETLLRHLLRGRPSVQAVSETLLLSLNISAKEQKLRMMGLLLDAGANVNFRGGEAILRATQSYDLSFLETLLQSRPNPESLQAAFAAASKTTEPPRRYNIYWRLLDAGARGDVVDAAVVLEIVQQAEDLDIIQLLAPHASIDYDGGRALCMAISLGLRRHVAILLQKKPQAETFQKAFKEALALDDERLQLGFCRMLLQAGPEEEFTYSPIQYAERGLCNKCQSQHPRLMELLMYYQTKDRVRKIEGEQLMEIINFWPYLEPDGQKQTQSKHDIEGKLEGSDYSATQKRIKQTQQLMSRSSVHQPAEPRQRMSQAVRKRRKSSPPEFSYQVEDFDFGSSERAAWALALDSTPRISRHPLALGGQQNERAENSTEFKDKLTSNRVRATLTVFNEGEEVEAHRSRPALRLRPATSHGQLEYILRAEMGA